MGYDEFLDKLNRISAEFRHANGREVQTVEELRSFLDRRLQKPKKKGLRSLKGLLL